MRSIDLAWVVKNIFLILKYVLPPPFLVVGEDSEGNSDEELLERLSSEL